MESSSVLSATLSILICICSLQTVATAKESSTLHISHYTHEVRGGPNKTLLISAGPGSADVSAGVGFGTLLVFDNAIREGVHTESKLLGRASGSAIGVIRPSPATMGITRVQMHMEHIFEEESVYNGSSISLVGIFFAQKGPWEMNVPGGTGHFKGYRGYGVAEELSETPAPPPIFIVYKWDFYLTLEK